MKGAWKVWDGKQWADLYNNATRPGRIALSSTPPPETVDLTATPAGARKPSSASPHAPTPSSTARSPHRARASGGSATKPGASRSTSASSGRSRSPPHEQRSARSSDVEEEVEKARARIRKIESHKEAKTLQQKFNTMRDDDLKKTNSSLPQRYDRNRVEELDKQAHEAALAAASDDTSGGDGAEWRKAAELFLQCFEAAGRERAQIKAEVEAEAAAQASGSSADSKHKRIRVRWRQARTLIFTMLAIDKQNAARVKEVAHELVEQYESIEPEVTNQLQHQVHDVGGKLIGLEYKLKSESSLFRKIMSDLDEERKAESGLTVIDVAAKCAQTRCSSEPCQPTLPGPSLPSCPSPLTRGGLTPCCVAQRCYDVLRYTCILETTSYVAGTTQILKNLDNYADETMTLAQFRVKNFWGKGDAYQGINSVYSIMVRIQPTPPSIPEIPSGLSQIKPQA